MCHSTEANGIVALFPRFSIRQIYIYVPGWVIYTDLCSTGKGKYIWDRLKQDHPELIKDNLTADVACNSYHLYKDDFRMLKELGVTIFG
jgi:hypothetical protein